jgi:putative hydrolase of the HAD superfamily
MHKHILFDLDETLYPRDAGLMQEIGARILRYLVERMGFTPEAAEAQAAVLLPQVRHRSCAA